MLDLSIEVGGFGAETALSLPKYIRLDNLSPSSTDLENSSAIVGTRGEQIRNLVVPSLVLLLS